MTFFDGLNFKTHSESTSKLITLDPRKDVGVYCLAIMDLQLLLLQISVQTAPDWFWVCSGPGNPQEPRIRCIEVTLVTQGMMQQRIDRCIFVSKFYVGSKKVNKKFLHHHYPVLKNASLETFGETVPRVATLKFLIDEHA